MNGLQRIVRNVSIVAAAQAITWTATFLFTLAQARYLEPARFAELSLALAYAALVAVIVDFGLSTKLARDVAQRPATAGQALVATMLVRVGLWCLVMPLVWASTVVLGYGAELQGSILILGASLLVGGFAASLGSYFQGREQFLFPSLGSIAQRGSAAVLGVAALALGHGVMVIALVYVASSIVQVLVMIPGMRRHPTTFTSIQRATVVDMFRGSAVLGCFWILGAVYYNIDMLILQRLVPLENVAIYAAAYRLFNAALTVGGIVLGMVLYPFLARLSVGAREELRRALDRSFIFLAAGGVFVALVVLVAADQVVALLYGTRYGQSATALRLLAPGLAVMYANGAFFFALLAMGFERRLLVMAAVLAVVNPLANLIAIPILQQNGAALITSVTEAAVLVWVLILIPEDLRRSVSAPVVAKILIAAAPAAACLWMLRDQIVVAVPVAAVLYAATALAIGTVPPDVMRDLQVLVRRARPVEHIDEGHAVAPGTVEP
jgi:O-antigen/teichoic acid export membrane protein